MILKTQNHPRSPSKNLARALKLTTSLVLLSATFPDCAYSSTDEIQDKQELNGSLPQAPLSTTEEVIARLTQGMSKSQESWAGNALRQVPLSWLEMIETAVNHLTAEMNLDDKSWTIYALSQAPSQELLKLGGANPPAINPPAINEHEKSEVIAKISQLSQTKLMQIKNSINSLTMGMSEDDQLSAIDWLGSVPRECLEKFEEVVNHLTQEMNSHDKSEAICALCNGKVPQSQIPEAENNAKSFVEMVTKKRITDALNSVPAEWLVEFEAAANRLTDGSGEYEKSWAIHFLSKVPAEQFPELEAIVNRLTAGINGENKMLVIYALSRVSAERFPELEAIVNRLTVGMDEEPKAYAIKDISKVPTGRLTEFESAINRLTVGMDGGVKQSAIGIFSRVPSGQLADFEAAANRLTAGIDGDSKSIVFSALARVPSGQLAAFEAAANRLTMGMTPHNRLSILSRSLSDQALGIITVNNNITDQNLQHLRQYVPQDQIRSLMESLFQTDPANYQRLIKQAIEKSPTRGKDDARGIYINLP
ncbi:MAG: hypothetical protein NTX76_05090 [Alphaproteobacteria bacterium]|nr:hypothetical protein [Alphaproteobacteria bacterium]